MKKLLLFLLFTPFISLATCPLIYMPIEERVSLSNYVVEAKVLAKSSFLANDKKFIYTEYVLQVNKLFKGQSSLDTFILITEGGVVGDLKLVVSPSIELVEGEIGVFFLKPQQYVKTKNEYKNAYQLVAGPLGVIFYDLESAIAWDYSLAYGDIQSEFLPTLSSVTNGFEVLNTLVFNQPGRRNAITIDSFSPTTITSGTKSVLKIKGQGFGQSIGNGAVLFRNADNGGTSFTPALKNDYIFWSDTLIELVVKRLAGTGRIRVRNNSNNTFTSTDTLTVNWAHLNIERGDTSSYTLRHAALTNEGGIHWVWDQKFYDNKPAVGAFCRALEQWRCASLIPWDTAGVVQNDTNLFDGKCMVFFDKGWLPKTTLGVCYSWYSGCFVQGSSDMEWFVSELDIVFRDSVNWEFGPQLPANGKTDMESVALHELGHGHQLGHVIDNKKVMHFSLNANTAKREISLDELDAAHYVMDKSIVSVCNLQPLQKLHPVNCTLTSFTHAVSASKLNPCLNEQVLFSDQSSGDIQSWFWEFGPDAIPDTASGKGPHLVSFSSPGPKFIFLNLSSENETSNRYLNNVVSVSNNIMPNADFSVNYQGNNRFFFQNLSSGDNNSYIWNFGDASPLSFSISPTHTFANNPQGNVVSLKATNLCGLNEKTLVMGDFTSQNNSFLSAQNWILFPNPAKESVTLSYVGMNNLQPCNVMVKDQLGRNVLNFLLKQNTISFYLKPGMYYIHINQLNGPLILPLIINE